MSRDLVHLAPAPTAADRSAHDTTGHVVSGDTADDIGAFGLGLEPKDAGIVDSQLKGLVVRGSQEMRGGISPGIAGDSPEFRRN